ncbi:hypothetical protein [Neisseria zalophi]|uniref:Uncharacterized protein n=1 Tax=Neisseria zalophi TaxID=640030 RepID=A0A5J6PTZ1_9NEIS|nr:hypothetical protein [Neisseria zalophi]QEY26188.1 hypothetical protein D0T92_06395 [Neisseria zalophi]
MQLSYVAISKMSNKEIINYLVNVEQKDLQAALEYISINLDSSRFPTFIDKDTFSFISCLFTHKKIIQNRGFFYWIVDFENSDLNFSKIDKTDRFNLIKEIMSLCEFYEELNTSEVGRFIIRCLLINKIERMEYINISKNNLNKAKLNFIDILYFMLLEYESYKELTESEKIKITDFLKEVSAM